MQKKTKWTTIKVPTEVRNIVKKLMNEEKKPAWKIIVNSVLWYNRMKRRPHEKAELPKAEKISWYITKLGMSVGAFKENPTKENLERLEKTLKQIKDRLGIDTDIVYRTAVAYMRKPNTENRMEVNMAVKSVIFEIIFTHIYKYEMRELSTSS